MPMAGKSRVWPESANTFPFRTPFAEAAYWRIAQAEAGTADVPRYDHSPRPEAAPKRPRAPGVAGAPASWSDRRLAVRSAGADGGGGGRDGGEGGGEDGAVLNECCSVQLVGVHPQTAAWDALLVPALLRLQ